MEYKKVRKLNAKQERFARELAVTGNAKQSAEKVGYTVNQAYKLKKHPGVIDLIDRLRAEADSEAALSVNKVLRELGQIGFANMLDYVDPKTGAVRLDRLDRAKAAAIVEYSVTETRSGRVTKIKLADKLGGLDRLARHLGIYEADNQQKIASPALDPQSARELARRVSFLLRNNEPPPAVSRVIDGEFETIPALSNSDNLNNSH